MMMRRIFSFLIVLLLFVGLFGCAQKTAEDTTTDSSSETIDNIEDVSTDEISDDSDLDIASSEDDLGEVI